MTYHLRITHAIPFQKNKQKNNTLTGLRAGLFKEQTIDSTEIVPIRIFESRCAIGGIYELID